MYISTYRISSALTSSIYTWISTYTSRFKYIYFLLRYTCRVTQVYLYYPVYRSRNGWVPRGRLNVWMQWRRCTADVACDSGFVPPRIRSAGALTRSRAGSYPRIWSYPVSCPFPWTQRTEFCHLHRKDNEEILKRKRQWIRDQQTKQQINSMKIQLEA